MAGNTAGPKPAEVRQDASADPSILADLAAVPCDVQVAEPAR